MFEEIWVSQRCFGLNFNDESEKNLISYKDSRLKFCNRYYENNGQ